MIAASPVLFWLTAVKAAQQAGRVDPEHLPLPCKACPSLFSSRPCVAAALMQVKDCKHQEAFAAYHPGHAFCESCEKAAAPYIILCVLHMDRPS